MTVRTKSKNRQRQVRSLLARDGATCWLCGTPIDLLLKHPHTAALTIDHMLPISKGGTNLLSNLRLAHKGCNYARAGALPEMVP